MASAYFAVSAVLCVQSWLQPDQAVAGVLAGVVLVALGTGTARLRRWAFRTTIFLCVVALVLAVPAFFPLAIGVGDPPPIGRQVAVFALCALVPVIVLAIAALVDRDLR